MKRKYLYPLSIFGAVLVFSSCNKYLDKEPDNRTEINSIEKVGQLVATAYPDRDYLSFAETASDNAIDKGPGVGNSVDTRDRPYAWEDIIGDGTNTTTAYWKACYEAIAAANQALDAIETYKLGAESNPYKGEALVARAYAHHMLAIFFATPYKIGANEKNDAPGIPYVTKPGDKVMQQYDRGTVKSTYENIVKDLEEGIPLIKSSVYKVPKFHFTKEAAHAFASRLYLFLGEWQKAVDHATLAGGSNFQSKLRPINSTMLNQTSAEFRTDFTKSAVSSTLLLTNAYSTWTYNESPRYGYGPSLTAMFNEKNVTGGTLANKVLSYSAANYTTYKWLYYFFYTGPGIGYPYISQPLLTLDETILNRAEAYAELGNYTAALNDLNTFYSTKIKNYSAASHLVTSEKIMAFFSEADPRKGIIDAVLTAKKAEFLQEGLRWLDIVRRDLVVVHNKIDVQGVETFMELKPGDPRRIFQLPEDVKLAGIELNPR